MIFIFSNKRDHQKDNKVKMIGTIKKNQRKIQENNRRK